MIEKPSHWIPYQFHHRLTVRNCLIISFACVSSKAHNLQAIFSYVYCVVPENIHTPPPRKGFPSGFSKISPQNLPPLPSGSSKIFAHPLEILLSLIEVNKEVVLFTGMPNFVSFM